MRVPKFFKKKSSVPNGEKEIISVYPPSSPHKIYDFDYYHSDKWDANEYGMEYDPSKPFFEEYSKLFFSVPHVPLERAPQSEGCEYSLGGKNGRDNYYTAGAFESQNVYYSFDVRFSRDMVDCNIMRDSEMCYDSVCSEKCVHCVAVDDCENCIDCVFLFNSKNCSHCFMSANLRNKSYVFRSRQLSKEVYEKEMENLKLKSRVSFDNARIEFKELFINSLKKNVYNLRSPGCIGDGIIESKNSMYAFRIGKSEHTRYADNLEQAKDAMDFLHSGLSELLYESVVGGGSNVKFSAYFRSTNFIEYCFECYRSDYCFGCIGLRDKKFHIFNQAFSESEYWPKIDEIKTKMLERGEYGEFFSLCLGFVPYQTSNAQKDFALSEEKAKLAGIPWYDEPHLDLPTGAESWENIPDNIDDVDDNILNKIFICKSSGRPFRFVKSEIDFMKKMGIPLPHKNPWERIMERVSREHGYVLYPFICPKCGEESFTIYKNDITSNGSVLCEVCYQAEVA
jgi:hypothetical protein